jgi:hypothetical protein
MPTMHISKGSGQHVEKNCTQHRCRSSAPEHCSWPVFDTLKLGSPMPQKGPVPQSGRWSGVAVRWEQGGR